MFLNNGAVRSALSVLLCSVLSGCFGGADRPDLGYVTGRVVRDGQPVKNITVVMKPDVGRPAMAVTDDDGNYDMEYTLGERGTKVGPTTVSFEWPLGYAGPFGIPSKWQQINSKEKIDVKPGSNDAFNFDLSDNAAPAAEPPKGAKSAKPKKEVIVD